MFLLALVANPVWGEQPNVWPESDWKTGNAKDIGFSAEKLDDLNNFLREQKTDALVIARHGVIVHEKYFPPFSRRQTHDGYSLAKSVTSAAVGLAVKRGHIGSTRDRVGAYLTERSRLNGDGDLAALTIEDLLNMRSGIEFINAKHYAKMMASPDSVGYILQLPAERPPGKMWRYGADPTLLSAIVARASGIDLNELAQKELFAPLGITSATWKKDASGLTNGNGDLAMTARDFARFGLLYQRQGVWRDRVLLHAEWIQESTAPCRCQARQTANVWENSGAVLSDQGMLEYRYLWWCRRLPGLPPDTFYAFGGHGQFIIVVPSLELVVVRLGSGPHRSDTTLLPQLARRMADCLGETKP